MKKSYIHFIRHGVTEGIVKKWYYGKTDLPLIEEGVFQLNKLREEGIYPSSENSSCYTSGMLRANQTFEVIFKHSNYHVIDDLREMDFGSWECKTFDELKSLEGFDLWINDKSGDFTFPEGDSPLSFQNRVSKGLSRLLANHFEQDRTTSKTSSIIVCHGGVIASCMRILLGEPSKDFWSWIPGPGRGYTVYFEDEKAVGYDKI